MDGTNTAEQDRIERSVGAGKQVKPLKNVLNDELDVPHLRRLAQSKPRTKAGQVRQVWPNIKTAQAAGHRLKDVRTCWLKEIGIEIGYARLSDYVGQLKRREVVPAPTRVVPEPPRSTAKQDRAPASQRRARSGTGSDPLALLEHERRQGLFDFNPEPDARKLI